MKFTFFNANPPGTVVAPDAFKKAIGQKVPVRNTHTGEVGEGTLLDVQVVDGGIEVTYETDMNLGVSINFPMKVEKLTARQMFPSLMHVANNHAFDFCDVLGKALDYIDERINMHEEADDEIIRLKELVREQERRWDEHSCMEGHICE